MICRHRSEVADETKPYSRADARVIWVARSRLRPRRAMTVLIYSAACSPRFRASACPSFRRVFTGIGHRRNARKSLPLRAFRERL